MSSKENLTRVSNTWPELLRLQVNHKHLVDLWDRVVKDTNLGQTPPLNWKNWPDPRLPNNENDFTYAFNFISDAFRPKNKHTPAWPMMYPDSLSPFARNWEDLSFQADTLSKVEKIMADPQYDTHYKIGSLQKAGMNMMIKKVKDRKCFFVGKEKEGSA